MDDLILLLKEVHRQLFQARSYQKKKKKNHSFICYQRKRTKEVQLVENRRGSLVTIAKRREKEKATLS